MKFFTYLCSLTAAVLLTGCVTSEIIPPPPENYGLSTESAYNGDQMIIDSSTPVLRFNNRLYYFQNQSELEKFRDDPKFFITRYPSNESPEIVPPLTNDFGLRTNCAFNNDPIVVSQYTPTLQYMGRIYYFAHTESRRMFMEDPQMYVAKFGANKVPKVISPLRAAYGTKTVCAASGIPILVGPHTPALEYMGEIFYFSDISSMEAFKKDPQAYINKKFNTDQQTDKSLN